MSKQILNYNEQNFKQPHLRIKKNQLLKDYTTFQIGGEARYFVETNNKEDIIEAVKWAKQRGLPFFVLGGGSNLLASDKGFEGLAIKVKSSKFTPLDSKHLTGLKVQSCSLKLKIVEVEAGVELARLVDLSAKEGLNGLEWAAGIPKATVGGAVRGDAGAFNKRMSDVVKNVEVLDAETLQIKTLSKKQCQFDYRESIFKRNNNLVILSAVLLFKKMSIEKVKNKIDYVLNYRQEHHPVNLPSAGCAFKNPSKTKSAAMLIDRAGLKGRIIGQAQISTKHPGFIINLGKASSGDVLELINLVKKEVKNRFDIALEEEVQRLPLK